MPRKRKAARRYRSQDAILLRWQREVLLHSIPILSTPDFNGGVAWRDTPAFTAAWKRHGRDLMSEWQTEPHYAGLRPYGWWREHGLAYHVGEGDGDHERFLRLVAAGKLPQSEIDAYWKQRPWLKRPATSKILKSEPQTGAPTDGTTETIQ